MLIYSGNTPIMLPINPSPKDDGNISGIAYIIILGLLVFLIYKLINL